MATNRGLSKLKKINAEAKKIREKGGFTIVKQAPKKVYKISQNDAISIATDRLYGKNQPSTMDGTKKKKSTRKKGK